MSWNTGWSPSVCTLIAALALCSVVAAPAAADATTVDGGTGPTDAPDSERIDGVTWVFDVAHNAAGVASMLEALPDLRPPGPRVAVIGVLGDKDWTAMLPPLFGVVDHALLVEPPSAPSSRRWDPERVLDELGRPAGASAVRPFAAALTEAAALAAGGSVICTGSVHTVGDAMLALSIPPFGLDPGLPPEGRGP